MLENLDRNNHVQRSSSMLKILYIPRITTTREKKT